MGAKIKKLKDSEEKFIVPITHSDAVIVDGNKTLTQKLIEIGTGGSGGSDETIMLNNAPSLYSYYEPKPEPSAMIVGGKVYKNWTVQEYYNMYDGLVARYPKYIRMEKAPYLEYSEQFELRRYVFEPEDGYEKTIYIGAGIHGNEHASKLSLARICQLVCEEWESSPQLTYLRNNVRMIINPIANPYGHSKSHMLNANGTANTNTTIGTNCNRNYDAFWGQVIKSGGSDHNGAYPFSERETQWVRDTILEYGPENFHYGFDFHDAGTRSIQGDFWISYNTFHKESLKLTRPLHWYLAKKYITNREPFIWHDKDSITTGTCSSWMNKTMGIPASTVENCYEGGPSTPIDSTFMTQSVDTYLNAVLINTIANHKTPVFKSNKKWFGLEWWKASGEHAIEPMGRSFNSAISLWDALVSKYPKYMKKSVSFVTSSDGNQVHHYSLEPKNYTKTVIIVGGRTEPNREPFNFSIAMLRLAELMCLHSEKDEHLTQIRDGVRIVFIPYLEYTTKYLNSSGYWLADGTPSTGQINVSNIISIIDNVASSGPISGIIYQKELNDSDKFSATTDDVFTLASQDTNDATYIESYVDYLKSKGLEATYNNEATSEFANYVVNKRSLKCVRIDTGLDHKTYELRKMQFASQANSVAIGVDLYLRLNHEIARRVTNIVNVVKLITK